MRKLMVLLVMAFLLAGCSDESADENEPEEVVTYESTTIESEQEAVEEEPGNEEVEEEEAPEEPQQVEVIWEQEEEGPMTFDAPITWKVSDDCFYAPHGPNDEYLGYYFSVRFNDYPSGNIDNFVSMDIEQYDDVVVDELEVAGYPAARLRYNKTDDDGTTANIRYYIQIYPEAGLGIIAYEAPESDPELYMEDFERLFNSLSIEGSPVQDSNNEKIYILNKSTGTFHTQDCYKVKQMRSMHF